MHVGETQLYRAAVDSTQRPARIHPQPFPTALYSIKNKMHKHHACKSAKKKPIPVLIYTYHVQASSFAC